MRLTSAVLGPALQSAPDAAAAATTVVDHIAGEQRLLPAVYLARGGRLRCAALHGYWQARDGLPGTAGIMGRTYRTATEVVVPDVSASADYLEANPGVVAEACFPLLAGGLTVGVLDVESREPLPKRPRAPARVRGRPRRAHRGARRPAPRVRHPAPAAPRRRLAALQDADAVADALLNAALDLVPLGSALLARTTAATAACGRRARPARWRRSCATPGSSRSRTWVQDGISCFTVGQPEAPPAAASLADLRAAGVETMIAVGLFVQGELLGALVLASAEPAVINTDDVELLEQLATHGAACLRTAELMGSLRERAESDPLTGLGHHATFHEALAGSHRRPTTAVVVCDIDGFKLLNDTYGHGHGDRVLCGVADAMSSALRRGDRLFRVGGDEFAGLLAVESREQALRRRAAPARGGRGGAPGGHGLHRGGRSARGRDRRRAAGAGRPRRDSVKAAGRDGVALANDEPLPATPALG